MPRRVDRLNEQLKREVADILRTRVKDPRVGMVTVTEARVTRDLSVATIYVVATGDAAAQEQTLAGLAAAAPFIRSALSERLTLRKVPELRFLKDATLEQAQRIERLLHEVFPAHPSERESKPDDEQSGT